MKYYEMEVARLKDFVSGMSKEELNAKYGKYALYELGVSVAMFDKITYYQAVEAVNKVGRILNKDDEKQECVAVVNSGIWNMNIAFVALKSECDKTYVAAFAKEGIIKQHTAQKAIDYIFSAISDDN